MIHTVVIEYIRACMGIKNASVNDEGDQQDHENEPYRATLTVTKSNNLIAVAVGSCLRVWDFRSVSISYASHFSADAAIIDYIYFILCIRSQTFKVLATNGGVIRSIAFSPCEKWLAAGGDDKTVILWDTETWQQKKQLKANKKITVVSFIARFNSLLLAATKFGDVLFAEAASDNVNFSVLLGHYCSVVTSISISSDERFLATTDRDSRARVTLLPGSLTSGAFEIQSYCFGHTNFINCCSFFKQNEKEVLLTGGGDGTVRMWDLMTGFELASLQVGAKLSTDKCQSVLALQATSNQKYAVMALDNEAEIKIVEIDLKKGSLTLKNSCRARTLSMVTDIASSEEDLWLISGPLKERGSEALIVRADLVDDGDIDFDAKGVSLDKALPSLQMCSEDCEQSYLPRALLPSYLYKKSFTAES